MKKFFLILGLILVVLVFRHLLAPVLEQFELITYDVRSKVSIDEGAFSGQFHEADQRIVIVEVDDFSRKEISNHPELNLGSWPWRRDVWAEVLEFIEEGNPKVVMFDLIFNGVDESKPYDKRLEEAFNKYDNVVLATSLNNPKQVADIVKAKGIEEEIPNSEFSPT